MSPHLIHPVLVHFAVALLVTGAVAEAAGILGKRAGLERIGSAASVVGVAFLVATIASGFLAANSVALPEGARGDLGNHERAGLVLLAVWLLLILWKAWYRGAIPDRGRAAFAAALLCAAALVLWVAWLGGHLVYGHGVGVGK